jgi:hypothetical protein
MAKEVIGVACHDAGGAYFVAAHCMKEAGEFRYFLEGPAVEIFKTMCNAIPESDFRKFIDQCDSFLCGSSGDSNLERLVVREARRLKKTSRVILDHYKNYKQRFILDTQEVVPNQILVTDLYAKSIAKKDFPNASISLIPNRYFEWFRANYLKFQTMNQHLKPSGTLYLSEGIDEFKSTEDAHLLKDDYHYLEQYISLHSQKFENDSEIYLRVHPSEKIEKYYRFKERKLISRITDVTTPLYLDFLCAKRVVGVGSMALMLATYCGLPTYSVLDGFKKSNLPDDDIVYLNVK